MIARRLPDIDAVLESALSLEDQVRKLGGCLTYLSKPLALESEVLRHTTSIIQDGDNVLVAQRAIQNRNGKLTVNWRENPSTIILSSLLEPAKLTSSETEVSLLESMGYSLEDVRLISADSRTISLIGAVWDYQSWIESGTRGVTSQAILKLSRTGEIYDIRYPNIGGNFSKTEYEKNWVPILGSNMFVYSLYPSLKIFDTRNHNFLDGPGISWDFGEPHGGTQIAEFGGRRVGLFHSSLGIQRRSYGSLNIASRTYFVGAFVMNRNPPYSIVASSVKPLLTASLHDPMVENSGAAILPQGLVVREDALLVSFGVNDAASAIAEIPISSVLEHLETQ